VGDRRARIRGTVAHGVGSYGHTDLAKDANTRGGVPAKLGSLYDRQMIERGARPCRNPES
jgi:hypothetical protein